MPKSFITLRREKEGGGTDRQIREREIEGMGKQRQIQTETGGGKDITAHMALPVHDEIARGNVMNFLQKKKVFIKEKG